MYREAKRKEWEKNVKLSKGLITWGGKHRTNVFISVYWLNLVLMKSTNGVKRTRKKENSWNSSQCQSLEKWRTKWWCNCSDTPRYLYTQLSIYLKLTFSLILLFHHICMFNFLLPRRLAQVAQMDDVILSDSWSLIHSRFFPFFSIKRMSTRLLGRIDSKQLQIMIDDHSK